MNEPNAHSAPIITQTDREDKLLVIWSSDDPNIATRLVFMYTGNSKRHGWWDRVQLCIWGPSAKLICEDEMLQLKLKELQDLGVELSACIACANSYGVTEKLRDMGITVQGMGQPLTEMLKNNWKVLSF